MITFRKIPTQDVHKPSLPISLVDPAQAYGLYILFCVLAGTASFFSA